MASRVGVIGATSFSGSSFCTYLVQAAVPVFPFMRPMYDLNSNPRAIADRIIEECPELVVNFAALNMVAESWPNYVGYYTTNVIGVARVVDSLRSKGWKGRWVQVSTPEVYGNCDEPVIEGRTFNPSTPYAVSRAACDMHLRAVRDSFGFDVVFTRSVNVYGPGQQLYRLIPKTVLTILRGEKLPLHGGGLSTRSFLHIDDVCEAIFRVAMLPRARGDYHIASYSAGMIGVIVELICEQMGVGFEDVIQRVEDRPGKDQSYRLSDYKLRRETGWNDKIRFKEGLRDTVQWYVNNADRYKGMPLTYEHKS